MGPPPPPLKNFSEGDMAAVDKEIVDLLKKGAIEDCSRTPGGFTSNILTVPKKSAGNWPVVDMRALNEFLEYIAFRVEDISLLKSVLKQEDFITKLDLKEAHLTVPVNKRLRIYPRFIWRGDSINSLASLSVSLPRAEFSPRLWNQWLHF